MRAELLLDDADEAGLLGDLAQGGLRERLALLDAALGQAPDGAAGRAG